MEENKCPPEREDLERRAQTLLEETESESRTRTYTGPMGKLLTVLFGIWVLFQLYFSTGFGALSAINLRAFHCIFLLVFTFLLYPTYKKEPRTRRLPPVWDLVLAAGAVLTLSLIHI